jgi:hypothetical protein
MTHTYTPRAGRVEGFAAGAEYVRAFSFQTVNEGIAGLHHVPALNWCDTAAAAAPLGLVLLRSRLTLCVVLLCRCVCVRVVRVRSVVTLEREGAHSRINVVRAYYRYQPQLDPDDLDRTSARSDAAGSIVQLAVPWSVHTLAVWCASPLRTVARAQ